MTPAAAIDIVARHLAAASLASNHVDWESYPEIGENDWEEITDRAVALFPYPSAEQYETAMELLKARADGDTSLPGEI